MLDTIFYFISQNILIILTFFVIVFLFSYQNYRLSRYKKELLIMHLNIQKLTNKVNIFEDGSQGVGRRLLATENQLKSLLTDQSEIKNKLVSQSFSEASNLVSKGYSLDEICSNTDLSKSEIELLFLLNEKNN